MLRALFALTLFVAVETLNIFQADDCPAKGQSFYDCWTQQERGFYDMASSIFDFPYTVIREIQDAATDDMATTLPNSGVVEQGNWTGYWYNGLGDDTSQSIILFFTGGGFVIGNARSDAPFFNALLGQVGLPPVRLLSVQFRLAPENRFPDAHQDARDAYRWVLDQGYAAENVIVMGVSSGGGQALHVAQYAAKSWRESPAVLVLISPYFDARLECDSCQDPDILDLFQIETAKQYNGLYLGGTGFDESNAIMSPALGVLEGLCHIFLIDGAGERLIDDNNAFVTEIIRAGGNITRYTHPYLYHPWPILPLDAAQAGIGAIADFVRGYV